jgi:hypothetical protein
MHTDPVRIAAHLVRFAIEGRIEEEQWDPPTDRARWVRTDHRDGAP